LGIHKTKKYLILGRRRLEKPREIIGDEDKWPRLLLLSVFGVGNVDPLAYIARN
jgi:hypothetical protein